MFGNFYCCKGGDSLMLLFPVNKPPNSQHGFSINFIRTISIQSPLKQAGPRNCVFESTVPPFRLCGHCKGWTATHGFGYQDCIILNECTCAHLVLYGLHGTDMSWPIPCIQLLYSPRVPSSTHVIQVACQLVMWD